MARLPALALVLPEVAARSEDYEPSLTRDVWALTAGVVRFTVRALEVHARDCGYAPDKWRAAALRRAELALEDADDTLGDRLGASVRTLAEAIAASEGDVIALPGPLPTRSPPRWRGMPACLACDGAQRGDASLRGRDRAAG